MGIEDQRVLKDLDWAVKMGDLESVKRIIETKGINVNRKDEDNGRAPLMHAADYGHVKVLEYLISKGADVNTTDEYGISALLAALWEGHTDCVKLLLEKGASRDGKTPDGMSYLDAAEKEEIKDLLK